MFWRNFERYSLRENQNSKEGKKRKAADFATNLNLSCCGVRLKFTKCTVFPSNVHLRKSKCALRGQIVHFMNCKRSPQRGRSLCSVIFFDRFGKILRSFKTCLWTPIQCTVSPRNAAWKFFSLKFCRFFVLDWKIKPLINSAQEQI